MTWKNILKSKKYEDMTEEEQDELDRRYAEDREKEYRKFREEDAKSADSQLEAINERIRREQSSSPKYFAQREMASIAGEKFPKKEKKS
jgi:hypothetical protein